MIPTYRPVGHSGGHSDQLPDKQHHSHRPHPSEGAPLLRQAPHQLIVINAPVVINNHQSAEQPLAPQLDSSVSGPSVIIPTYRPVGQSGGHSDQLPDKQHHSHRPHPSEGAPLLRQAPRQLIVINAPVVINNNQSAEQPLAPQLHSSV
jgi:hypothetical protein